MHFEVIAGNSGLTNSMLVDAVQKIVSLVNHEKNILTVVPDITRMQSRAGDVLEILYSHLENNISMIIPALGTHLPMTDAELSKMYPKIPHEKFAIHDWRHDVIELGRIPASFVRDVGEGVVDYDYPVQVNRALVDARPDVILSIGQVVPHEVVGMGNHAKNIFVGLGGKESIDKSHYLGACYGMERIIGRIDTPVRRVFNKALEISSEKLPKIIWILTVVEKNNNGENVIRGLFEGDDLECFYRAAALSQELNITFLDEEIEKAIIWLDPAKYRSTWVANKSVHHVRMAMADSGEMTILAPGLAQFGEDKIIDSLIRKYGYRPYAEIARLTEKNEDLKTNLAAAAHLIHGSSDGRFRVIYAPGTGMTKEEIQSVGYEYASFEDMNSRYRINELNQGWNIINNREKIFFVSDPSTGLWTSRRRFSDSHPH